PAGPAPLGPEVDDDRRVHRPFQHLLLEGRLGHVDDDRPRGSRSARRRRRARGAGRSGRRLGGRGRREGVEVGRTPGEDRLVLTWGAHGCQSGTPTAREPVTPRGDTTARPATAAGRRRANGARTGPAPGTRPTPSAALRRSRRGWP